MARHTSAKRGSSTRTGIRLGWAIAMAMPVAARGQVAPPTATPPPAEVAPPPTPAVAELQSDLDQKKYGQAVRVATKLLGLQGEAAAGFSRFQVLMLKGDAQLGSQAYAAARVTYREAQRSTRDPHEQALATWTVELLRQSHGATYVPHVTAGAGVRNATPFDLTDPDGRRSAFGALLEDELSALGPVVRQASTSPSLPSILAAVRRVQPLAELDEIANGSDARTAATAGTLVEHARTLMATALKGMWTRTADIHAAATQQVTGSGGTMTVNGQPVQQTVTGVNGLTPRDQSELRDIIDSSNKIRDAAQTFMPLAAAGTDKDWGTVLNDAARVAGRASDVLNANYSSTSVSSDDPDSNGTGGIGGSLIGGGIAGSTVYYPPGGNGQSGTFPNGPGYGGGFTKGQTSGGTTQSLPGNTPPNVTPTPTVTPAPAPFRPVHGGVRPHVNSTDPAD